MWLEKTFNLPWGLTLNFVHSSLESLEHRLALLLHFTSTPLCSDCQHPTSAPCSQLISSDSSEEIEAIRRETVCVPSTDSPRPCVLLSATSLIGGMSPLLQLSFGAPPPICSLLLKDFALALFPSLFLHRLLNHSSTYSDFPRSSLFSLSVAFASLSFRLPSSRVVRCLRAQSLGLFSRLLWSHQSPGFKYHLMLMTPWLKGSCPASPLNSRLEKPTASSGSVQLCLQATLAQHGKAWSLHTHLPTFLAAHSSQWRHHSSWGFDQNKHSQKIKCCLIPLLLSHLTSNSSITPVSPAFTLDPGSDHSLPSHPLPSGPAASAVFGSCGGFLAQSLPCCHPPHGVSPACSRHPAASRPVENSALLAACLACVTQQFAPPPPPHLLPLFPGPSVQPQLLPAVPPEGPARPAVAWGFS